MYKFNSNIVPLAVIYLYTSCFVRQSVYTIANPKRWESGSGIYFKSISSLWRGIKFIKNIL